MKWLLKLFSIKTKIWMGSFNMMHTFYTKDKCSIKNLPDFKFTPPSPTKNR
jgi:hypothetical protein